MNADKPGGKVRPSSIENRSDARPAAGRGTRSRLSLASRVGPGPRGPSEELPCAANRRIIDLQEAAYGNAG